MPDRLRELIVKLSQESSLDPSQLADVARRIEAVTLAAQPAPPPEVIQRTVQQIIAEASATLRAQATIDQTGVKALLQES